MLLQKIFVYLQVVWCMLTPLYILLHFAWPVLFFLRSTQFCVPCEGILECFISTFYLKVHLYLFVIELIYYLFDTGILNITTSLVLIFRSESVSHSSNIHLCCITEIGSGKGQIIWNITFQFKWNNKEIHSIKSGTLIYFSVL